MNKVKAKLLEQYVRSTFGDMYCVELLYRFEGCEYGYIIHTIHTGNNESNKGIRANIDYDDTYEIIKEKITNSSRHKVYNVIHG